MLGKHHCQSLVPLLAFRFGVQMFWDSLAMCIQEWFGGSVCASIELSRGGPLSFVEGISLSVCRGHFQKGIFSFPRGKPSFLMKVCWEHTQGGSQ